MVNDLLKAGAFVVLVILLLVTTVDMYFNGSLYQFIGILVLDLIWFSYFVYATWCDIIENLGG